MLIAPFLNYAAPPVTSPISQKIPPLKYMLPAALTLVLLFSILYVSFYLIAVICSRGHLWAGIVAYTMNLTMSTLIETPNVVTSTVFAHELLPIVCCLVPRTSYFVRRYGWITAMVVGLMITTLEANNRVFAVTWPLTLWFMSWGSATWNIGLARIPPPFSPCLGRYYCQV
ncbi:hypothetical protein HD806DRAFT_11291 [Xylariaceae sp. AK1471]|nr:hypothetical protein HD806DRAFT_11291 [Xylariaceae sp. AK1471]